MPVCPDRGHNGPRGARLYISTYPLPPRGTLPVAGCVLPGPPSVHEAVLTGQRHPVAEALDRSSRYWLELPAGFPILSTGRSLRWAS